MEYEYIQFEEGKYYTVTETTYAPIENSATGEEEELPIFPGMRLLCIDDYSAGGYPELLINVGGMEFVFLGIGDNYVQL